MRPQDFLTTAVLHPGATEEELATLEGQIGRAVPDDLRAMLRSSNGFEGFISPTDYLMIWSTAEVADFSRSYDADEVLSGITLIGTDGANTGYGIRWSDESVAYCSVPLVGMEPSEVVLLGSTFTELLARIQDAARDPGRNFS